LYLSGWLNRLTDSQRDLVAQAVAAHKRLLSTIVRYVPFWPLGLPGWNDEWVALGLQDKAGAQARELHLTIWRRGERPGRVSLTLPPASAGLRWDVPAAVFPGHSPLSLTLSDDCRSLDALDDTGLHAARVVTLKAVTTKAE
ncbi:MAG TPA: hypothetical protein VGD91_17400, partial [Trebonia sp.]